MRKLTMLALAVCFFAGAASAQEPAAGSQTTDAKSSKATVYVYRYKQFVGSALAPSVWCDETELARMENGRYFTVTLDPGKHNFRSNDKQSGIELDAKAGQEYFVRVEIAEVRRLIAGPGEQAAGVKLSVTRMEAAPPHAGREPGYR